MTDVGQNHTREMAMKNPFRKIELTRRLMVSGLLLTVSLGGTTLTTIGAAGSSQGVTARTVAHLARNHVSPAQQMHHAITSVTEQPTSSNPLRVALYGDSLAFQAQDFFVNAIHGEGPAIVQPHTFGGTAICDYLPQMRVDASAFRPQAVVVEFSGNALTPCMQDVQDQPLAGAALLARYATDAQQVLDVFAASSARVYFVSYPISRTAAHTQNRSWNQLNELYMSLPQRDPSAEFVDAARAVEQNGLYTDALPCLAGEPCTGGTDGRGRVINIVRAPDGVHFCPGAPRAIEGVTAACPVWSSGASRYGTAMAAPVMGDFFGDAIPIR